MFYNFKVTCTSLFLTKTNFDLAGKKLKSAKVFSTLSFNRSFKFAPANGIDKSFRNSNSNSYSHGNTLYKILEEEQRLYKLVMVNHNISQLPKHIIFLLSETLAQ